MFRLNNGLVAICVLSLAASTTWAQSVISAQAGTIHMIEGDASVDGARLVMKASIFPQLHEKSVLTTQEGRAEILLTPGSFLRVGENSGVRMVSSHLTDVRLDVEAGAVILECAELLKENSITLQVGDVTVRPAKAGVYRIDVPLKRIRVYNGELLVMSGGKEEKLKEGRQISTGDILAVSSFDKKELDELALWSSRRDAYVASANVASSRSMSNWGSGYNSTGNSGWLYNSAYGLFSFFPVTGFLYSPYGYSYFNPQTYYTYVGNSGYSGRRWNNEGSSGFVPVSSNVGSSTAVSSVRSDAVSVGGSRSAAAGSSGAVSSGGGMHSGGGGGSHH